MLWGSTALCRTFQSKIPKHLPTLVTCTLTQIPEQDALTPTYLSDMYLNSLRVDLVRIRLRNDKMAESVTDAPQDILLH